ncbi:hypothetical protein C0584_03815 [Candidatus Parcubacteria bacterium]|nr:MAG: hypothetical protein C0584_03815 [Candidatus Parcubacteria bacterium]
MNREILKLRILLWGGLFLLVVFFVYKSIVPSGHISYKYDFSKRNSFISRLSPSDRVLQIENGEQGVIGDPVYFSLRTSRPFNSALMTIKYRNNNQEQNPLVESGFLADAKAWRYKLEPVENYFLNVIEDNWESLERDGLKLYINPEASSTYQAVDDFLKSPPASDKIATYNYSFDTNYILDNYASSSKILTIEKELRADYQFFTYIDNEDLYFKFVFEDINQNKDSDDIDLFLYFNNQLIQSKHLDDDGISEDSGEIAEEREIIYDLVNMPSGAYKIELRAGDDVLTKSIETKQNKLSFINKIWISDQALEDFSVITDSDVVHFQTTNPGSLQNIKLSSSTVNLDETFRQFSQETNGSSTEIIFEKGDIIIAGNGVFSFSGEEFLNPRIKKVDSNYDIDDSSIDYILARYQTPEETNNLKTQHLEFDISGAYREDSKYSFLISIPGLKADDEIDDSITIDEIEFDLYGVSLFEKILSIFNKNEK